MCARPNVSEKRIPQILEAALRVFGEQGLAEARMDDIADAAGLSKATIYLYFDSKDALIEKLLLAYLDQTLAGLKALSAEQKSVHATMQSWISVFTSELEDNAGYTHLGFEFLALAARKPELRAALNAYYAEYSELIETVLQSGIDTGELSQHDTRMVASSIIAACEGVHLIWLMTNQQPPLEVQIWSMVENTLDATANPKP